MEDRSTGIGGSDIGALIQPAILDPFNKTPYEVYEEKVCGIRKEIEANDAVIWGNLLEQPIANRYEDITGKPLACSSTFRHPKYDFLMANPDRLVIGEPKGLEIKTTGYHMREHWGEEGSQKIPERYYMQVAHYMLVLGYPTWDLAVLIGGQDFRIFTFERDKEIDEIIISVASNFWNNNVKKKIPPEKNYSNKNVQEIIRKKYNLVSEEVVNLGDNLIEVADKIEQSKNKIKEVEKIKEENCAIIRDAIGNAGVAYLSDGRKFIRKMINRKSYSVAEKSFIQLDLKGA